VAAKKAPAPVFESIPELDKSEVAPPVRNTLLALLKIPALEIKAAPAV
jgi:hypothetical protein